MSANADVDAGVDPDAPADADETDSRQFRRSPPRTVTDAAGRTVECRVATDGDREALAAMYDAFGIEGRAQGIPPADPDRRREWLDTICDGIGVVATHGGRAVGHGVLLAGGPGHELALFVHPDYRSAGIGTALLRALLGRGEAAGVERVWLSVRRGNRPAVSLYRRAEFSVTESGLGELEMSRPL
ncbi:GNAT family N-acetyltransferase [Halorussus marinus]|uniref:GNAT family N-acetyltransferase n=1 Tax=Halorussus marinus TaxID=2505976 RepID=UPI00106DE832|nr:GNAT family N-acetyltransferase [Halorussus marinus]